MSALFPHFDNAHSCAHSNSVEGLETSRSYAALLEDPYKRYQQLYQQYVLSRPRW
jgi:hypothetical protein